MNIYENSIPCCDEVKPLEGTQRTTLTTMMDTAKGLSFEALNMANVIRRILLGNRNNEDGTPKREVTCYMEDMAEHCCTLKELCEVLHRTIEELGV